MEVFIEPNVTVVLGPNDHGKTNLMHALLHLNGDTAFDEEDLNWDCSEKANDFPVVEGVFTLSDSERAWLLDAENKARQEINDQIQERDEEFEEDGQEEIVDTAPPTRLQPTLSIPKPRSSRQILLPPRFYRPPITRWQWAMKTTKKSNCPRSHSNFLHPKMSRRPSR